MRRFADDPIESRAFKEPVAKLPAGAANFNAEAAAQRCLRVRVDREQRNPRSARPAPRFKHAVVLATPPFWFARAMIIRLWPYAAAKSFCAL